MNNPPTFRMSGSPVNVLRVTDEKGWVVWQIEQDAKVDPISSVTYGNVPKGYKEEVRAETLVDGQTYIISGAAGSGHDMPGELRLTAGEASAAP